MEYEFDKDLGLHFYFKANQEVKDYFFFCSANLKLKNKVELVYSEDQNSINKTKTIFVNYSEVKNLIESKFVLEIYANEDQYSIIISSSEICVRSFDKNIAENIFRQLFN